MSDNINNRLPQDSLGNPIQVAKTFRTYDAHSSAVKSPISLSTATNQLITIPKNAVIITIYSNQILKLGITADDVGGTNDGYTLIPIDASVVKNIAGLDSFYLRNDSGNTATIYFDFAMV